MGLECLATVPFVTSCLQCAFKTIYVFFYSVIRAVNILCLHLYKKAEKTNTLVYHSVVYFVT